MNSILVEYRLYDSPKALYQTVTKLDLMGNATVLELIALGHGYPIGCVTILDLLPSA